MEFLNADGHEGNCSKDARIQSVKKPRREDVGDQVEESKEQAEQSTTRPPGPEDVVDFALQQVFEHSCATSAGLAAALRKLGVDASHVDSLVAGEAPDSRSSISFAGFRDLTRPVLCSEAARVRASVGKGVQVFLGGACNPTTWRKDVALPLLEAAGVTFYNPQVEEWSPELVGIEAHMKASAQVLLFVVAAQTRSISSMIEAAEHIARRRSVVLVIEALNPDLFHPDEIKDLQRGRAYLADVAKRHGVPVHADVPVAVSALIRSLQA